MISFADTASHLQRSPNVTWQGRRQAGTKPSLLSCRITTHQLLTEAQMATPASAKCERTGKQVSLADGFFIADPRSGEWSFVSKEAPERSTEYIVPIASIVRAPEALVDWMAHLNEKTWFDARKFMDFFTRFRRDNGLYKAL